LKDEMEGDRRPGEPALYVVSESAGG
jgi:hypothetical protein